MKTLETNEIEKVSGGIGVSNVDGKLDFNIPITGSLGADLKLGQTGLSFELDL